MDYGLKEIDSKNYVMQYLCKWEQVILKILTNLLIRYRFLEISSWIFWYWIYCQENLNVRVGGYYL